MGIRKLSNLNNGFDKQLFKCFPVWAVTWEEKAEYWFNYPKTSIRFKWEKTQEQTKKKTFNNFNTNEARSKTKANELTNNHSNMV